MIGRRKRSASVSLMALLLGQGAAGAAQVAKPAAAPTWQVSEDRRHLPIPAPTYHGQLGGSIQESSPQAFPPSVRAPKGAPNIVLIMTDDVGFGTSSTFGGLVATPTLDMLAAKGLRFNEFHDTALCSPTRAALLTGRNAHRVGFGNIAEMSTGYPGYNTILPNSAATIGKVLTYNGYSTAWIGKNHNTPPWEITPDGPFDRWPSRGLGFDYFYGFMTGATNQFAPELYENTRALPTPTAPGYVLDHDLSDHAINWLQNHHTAHPDRPFFLYYATGSTHSPNQAPREWIEKFRGRFDAGWDKLREQVFARQKQLGVIPADARLSPRPAAIPAWDSLSADEKKVAARLMEAAAGQLAYCDNQIGRMIAELKRQGVYDNTLIMYMQGDNGQSSEGGVLGTVSDIGTLNARRPDTKFAVEHLDEIGTSPTLQNNIPSGFAWAMDTPFQWFKAIASHLGGMRNDLVISWPGHVRAPEVVRSQFHHVIDIVPTIYQAAGIPAPDTVDGVRQMSLDGVSMAYTFDHPAEPSHRSEQIFEMLGNRAFYKDGWMVSTTPKRTVDLNGASSPPGSYSWELYDLRHDFSQAVDIAAANPKKLAEMRTAFEQAARANYIDPVQPVSASAFLNPLRPTALGDRTSFTFGSDRQRYSDGAFPDVKNRSWKITVRLDTTSKNANGTLVAQGGRLGGWGIRLDRGRPQFLYSVGPAASDGTTITADRALSPGAHELTVNFTYDGGGFGKGGAIVIEEGGKTLVTGRVPATVPFVLQEGASIGQDYGTTVSPAYSIPDRFDGAIQSVNISLAK